MKRGLLMILLVVLLAGCGGSDKNDKEESPTATTPPEAATQETTPEAELPAIILEALQAQAQGTPPISGLPFDLPGVSGSPPIENESFVTDFSILSPGSRVSISGQLEVVTDSNGQQLAVVRDPQGNEIALRIALPLVQSYVGQTIQLTGSLVSPETEGGRLVLQNASVITGQTAGLPEFLASIAQQGTQLPPDQITPVSPMEPMQPVTLDIQLQPNLTALQTYDALVAALGAEALSGLAWVAMAGTSSAGWVIQFDNPANDRGVEYIIMPDGVVQSRPITMAALPGIVNIPMDRARVVMDSDQVVEQSGNTGALLTLRAADESTYYWQVVGTELTYQATP